MDRPYCLQELTDLESELHDKYRLSNIFAQHYPCGHKYRVKKGGRKEQFILDTTPSLYPTGGTRRVHSSFQVSPPGELPSETTLDDQTCSVCFKLRTSVDSNKPVASVIDNIKRHDGVDDPIDIEFLKQKTHFYKWLFQHDY